MAETKKTWETLMAHTLRAYGESADYVPGQLAAPGTGSEGDDPIGVRYANFGPLAFVLNEAVDATITRGADRSALLDQIVESAGEEITLQDVQDVLSDKMKCPDVALLTAFGTCLSIDTSIILDAAKKGGCKNYGYPMPPGY